MTTREQIDADRAALRDGRPTDAARRRQQIDEDMARMLSIRRPPVRPTTPTLPPTGNDRPPQRRFFRATPKPPTSPPNRLTEAQRRKLGCCEHVAAWRATLPPGDR